MVTDRETLHLSREEQEKWRLHPKYHTLEYYLRVGTLQRKERERRGPDNPQRSVCTSVTALCHTCLKAAHSKEARAPVLYC